MWTYAQLGHILEAAMLVCFGFSWPVSIAKVLRTKKVAGKSLGFLALVFVGYLAGIAAKFMAAHAAARPVEWVTALYAFNVAIVAVDAALYVHYSRRQ